MFPLATTTNTFTIVLDILYNMEEWKFLNFLQADPHWIQANDVTFNNFLINPYISEWEKIKSFN